MYQVKIYICPITTDYKCTVSAEINIPSIGAVTFQLIDKPVHAYASYAMALKVADAFPDKDNVFIHMPDYVSDYLFRNEKAVVTTNNNHPVIIASLINEAN